MRFERNPLAAGLLAAALFMGGCAAVPTSIPTAGKVLTTAQAEARAESVSTKANKDWKLVSGEVTKLLPDDLNGSKHQHFLFETAEGKTVKIAHNIDLAAYVPVKVGDAVEVKCEYIKASPYDVAHWTHYDPKGGEGGYIKHKGIVYDRLPGAKTAALALR